MSLCSAVCDLSHIFLFCVTREMGELCVAAGQVQSGGSQPVLSSSAPASRSDSTDLEVRWWDCEEKEREGIVVRSIRRAGCCSKTGDM